jgi:tetratricopeptide (TPR) repeat protein
MFGMTTEFRDMVFRLLALAAIAVVVCPARASAQDSSDMFLQAYTLFQTGEQMENGQDPQRALAKFREAEKILAQITREFPDWQPMVVEYRLGKTRENIARLDAITKDLPPLQEELEGELPKPEPPARAAGRPARPVPAVTTSPGASRPGARSSDPLPPAPPDAASSTLSKTLRDLAQARKDLADAKTRNKALEDRVEKAEAEVQSALVVIDKTKVSVVELKSQLAQARDTIENLKRDGPDMGAIRAQRQEETNLFLKKLAEAGADAEVLQEENERLFAKLERAATYIGSSDAIRRSLIEERAALASARDQAAAELEGARREADESRAAHTAATEEIKELAEQISELTRGNQELEKALADARESGAGKEEIDRLMAENIELTKKLAGVRMELEEAGGGAASAALQSELNSVNDRLLQAEAEIARRDARIEDLARQLDETSGELARLRLLPVPSPEEQRLLAENDVLRGIILRQIKQQNRRDEAHRALEEELATLQVESATLRGHIAVLATPVLELLPDERSLFKDPVSLLTEAEPSRLEVDIAITKPTTEEAIANITPQAPKGASSLSPDARELVRTAQQLFDEKNYTEAEKTYQNLAAMVPDNYFVLSNLGAVQIEAGKLAAAEVALAKAIEISPEDSFAHTHLGIAHSRQGRFDDARAVLTRATELDANDAVAFNYLGVCLAQQGMRDDSEKHLKRAIAIDPNYANAHFNLAVLYATTKPPAVELAKQHYDLATRLGATPDASLERLIQ